MAESQTWYRKYRSKDFESVVGQEHITETLENALNKGRIAHAYLFTGPHGVGKTSVARIFAFRINKLPYQGDGSQHLDVIEIDAASNRRIDEIRDLRDKVNIAPTSADYKVYIIDEVHMLTKEAFNALLKTLEEPPAHVVFILATTEPHKLPETIISRTQRHNFLPISEANLVKHLKQLAKEERLDITDEALGIIARHARGSARDSVSLLNQLSHTSDSQIDAEAVRQLLGLVPADAMNDLMQALADGNGKEILTIVDEQITHGTTPASLAEQLADVLREKLSEGELDASALTLIDGLLDVPGAYNPRIKLETILLGFALGNTAQPRTEAKASVTAPKRTASREATKPENKLPPKPSSPRDFDETVWSDFLERLKQQHSSLYAVVRMAQPNSVDKTTIELKFRFPFHQKQIDTARNREILEQTLSESMGSTIRIQTAVDGNAKTPLATEVGGGTTPVSSIIDLMGGGEIVNLQ